MEKNLQLWGVILLLSFRSFAQDTTILSNTSMTIAPAVEQPVTKIKRAIDIPLTVVTGGWGILGSTMIYSRDTSSAASILALDRKNINGLDRWVSYNYSTKAAKASDYFFVASMPLPLILLFDKKIRREGDKVGLLYLEAMGITSALYVTSAMLADRYRPYTYNPNVVMGKRTGGGGKNSFFAGHVAIVTTSVFFTAQTYINYHPEMKRKWILYTGAGLLSATTGYLRIQAGQHFLTDVALGVAVGTLSGILVPYLHKNRAFKNSRLTILPSLQRGSNGMTLLYNLDKKRLANTSKL